ncbi:hypothetical protein Bra3105_17840 [Brachybacterium halotolerans subsp. kimchii]|uniref:hypothetical protein n=1 Tax=Brachybacterium halotolerans TaxID=2795215 RepID=UPI001E565CEB|nr:hypothetical protein [Brachybacterium halotolerans]UEJ82664.1 hypothetical protein Bra3105_17840 [Brachybacterium halotolerans subsp. kimchii]
MSITDRARAEAEDAATIAHSPIRREDGTTYDSDEHIAYRRGFVTGAEWAASLPPTDEEVREAAGALWLHSEEPGTFDEASEDWTKLARIALTAAREAQR